VPDYPFLLKTACKLDYRGWKRPKYLEGQPVYINKNRRLCAIFLIEEYFRNKSTIEEDLQEITGGDNCIISIHCPPYGLDLDVCKDGRRVGSASVYKWIEKEQPLLVLCGHIHESFEMSKIWKNTIGKTVIIQPGQSREKTHLVEIDIDEKSKITCKLHILTKGTLET